MKTKFTNFKGKGKQTKLMPQREPLNKLAGTQRTITDYSKATPLGEPQPTSLLTQFMGKK